MSCSAKLPIYAFFTAAFFPGKGAIVMIGLYFFGILMALLAEEAQQLSPQLGGGGAGGVDNKVRPLLDGGHHGPLLLHRLLQGVGVCRQGMAAAGLLVPLDDDLRRGLQKQHPALGLHVLQLIFIKRGMNSFIFFRS